MPSMLHEALVLLFQNRPSLAPELLRDALHQRLPDYDDVEIKDSNLGQVVPTEYHADLVVLLHKGKPVFGIVVEVQLSRDEDKVYTWPFYALALRSKYRCPTCVMVVTVDAEVTKWAARPIEMGSPGSVYRPLVLGPSAVPWITDAEQARKVPELAVLSAQAHGKEERGLEVAVAALAAAHGLDDERALLYCDLVYMAVNEAARKKLEEQMQSGTYEYQSEFARRYLAEGKAKGKAEGEVKGKADALLRIMQTRRLDLSDKQRGQVQTCTDIAVLDEWIERALLARSADEVFRDKG